MGRKFEIWQPMDNRIPETYGELTKLLVANRGYRAHDELVYGDHGLGDALNAVYKAIREGKRIALYADYDVDGTMSCVSWIWFLRAGGYHNFLHYIPCRFEEGYGVNLSAIKKLIHEHNADMIITMDTGITANEEAAYCRQHGVEFICTDHHKIQPNKMPDCIILNPKLHPEEDYQELCGCGITFVLLRQLAQKFEVPKSIWTDLLALAGMATICDVVPLNGVNHRLAKLGVAALLRSQRPILQQLRHACSVMEGMDEKDVGFRLGPRINAVGRLEHADSVVRAFVEEQPDELISHMEKCNERRKVIQRSIVTEAQAQVLQTDHQNIVFVGGDWHTGVVGIAASKIAEQFWRPTWLFQRKNGVCKGSARSIPGFDVTEAMAAAGDLFDKFGGHRAAGGFTFAADNELLIQERLNKYAEERRQVAPDTWRSRINFDCLLPHSLVDLDLTSALEGMKPFGHGFEEPKFCLEAEITDTRFFRDKQTGEPKHTSVTLNVGGRNQRVMFFNEVHDELQYARMGRFVVSANRNTFRGVTSLSLFGHDYDV